MRSSSIIIALLALVSCDAKLAKRERPPLPTNVEFKHIEETVKFKVKRSEDKLLRGEDEQTRVSRMVGVVSEAVSHLSEGAEPTRVFRHGGSHEEKHVDAGLHLWYRLNTKNIKDKTEEFAGQRRALAIVEHIRSNANLADIIEEVQVGYKTKQLYSTDDPRLSDQVTYHYDSVNLESAWELTGGDSSVVVQVVDSGMDTGHEDLQNNKWVNSGETDCSDGVDNDGNGYIDDCYGYNLADDTGTTLKGDGSHGTHCAGTVAADNDNGVGVAGVAGGKGGVAGASMMTNVVFGNVDTDGFDEAFIYGADNGAHISSNSWGYTISGAYDSAVLDAIDYADDAGVIVVFAAGNDGTNDDWYPGYYSPTIAVAALDKDKVAAYFTNYGDWLDISAPGYPVLSTVDPDDSSGESYAYYSGTSMACPHVAGGLALAKSYAPSATKAEIVACLFSTAEDVSSYNTATYTNGLGAGLMDIHAMMLCLDSGDDTDDTTTDDADDAVKTCSDLGWDATKFGETDVCGATMDASGTCSGKKSWADAESFCVDQGARLCTLAEIQDDEARGTGCNYDKKTVWTSTACGGGGNKYYAASGSTKASNMKCKNPSKVGPKVRCCADV